MCSEKKKKYFWKGRKHCGKRRKCWLPSPTIFSKAFFLKVIKSWDCMVEGIGNFSYIPQRPAANSKELHDITVAHDLHNFRI